MEHKKFQLNNKRPFVPHDCEKYVIDYYLDGHTAPQTGEYYGISPTVVYRILKKHNIKSTPANICHRKYSMDYSFFDVIDTQEKAYFMGILYADGYNNENNGAVAISLVEDDKEILEKLNQVISSTKPLQYIVYRSKNSKRKNQYRLNIADRRISSHLAELGIMQAKTFKITFPQWLDKSLYNHFIRGYLDGDGHIGYSGTNGRFEFVGTREFCEAVADIIEKECNVKPKTRKRFKDKPEEYNIVQCGCGGNLQVIRILDYIYKDATIYMERKHKKYIEILEIHNSVKRTNS